MTTPIISRFAPSPTGFMHIGSLRTALFAYLAAKQTNGTFILRIEDTDKAREVAGSIEHIMESLRWLGLEWDIGPDKPGEFISCVQSERLANYKKYANILVSKGLAYADPYTQAQMEEFRADAAAKKVPFLYRDYRPENPPAWDGTQPLRLKSTPKRYHWNDAVRGELEAGEEMVDDVILIKSDGYPTYNFAHIVDDLEMGVTHIMRGDEFISSQPKFLSIYDALEIPYLVFVSLPPILRDDRTKKLGKRDGAKDILDYKSEGYLPAAMINFLALIGWNPGTEQEVFTLDELVETFSINKIQRGGGSFNPEKLLWMNKMHLAKLSDAEFLDYLIPFIPEVVTSLPSYKTEVIERILETLRERVAVGSELTEAFKAGEYDWLFTSPTPDPEVLKWKNDPDAKAAAPRLKEVLTLLNETDFTSSESIKEVIWPYAETVGKGEVLWPLRVALTGRAQSPDPFTCLYTLGKGESQERIEAVISFLTQ